MSDNLSGPQQSDLLKYNGKYDSSKFFTPDLKLDTYQRQKYHNQEILIL